MIRSTKDFWSGLIYICLGSSAMIIAQDYSMGTAVKMGPAYFPTILGGLLVLNRDDFSHSLFSCNRHSDRRFRIQRTFIDHRIDAAFWIFSS